ncbi:MAG: response regulator [Acidimicrobiales bacterium]
MPTTVVVVEDEPLLRAGLRELLGAEGSLDVVGDAADGAQALEVIAATNPDVALVDIRMPGIDGIEVTRRVAAGEAPPKVLLLTTFASEEYLIDGLRAGASGFLVKTASPEQVIDAIHSVAAGESVVAPSMTKALIDRAMALAAGEQRVTQPWKAQPEQELQPETRPPSLSPREMEVLHLLGQGCSDKAIARALGVKLPTVKSHVHRVLTKLDVTSRTQAALAARDFDRLAQPGPDH